MLSKAFNRTKRIVCSTLAMVILLSFSTTLTGCTVDNTLINSAIINSAIMETISALYLQQKNQLDDLLRCGVISFSQYNTLEEKLAEEISENIATLGYGGSIIVDASENTPTEDTPTDDTDSGPLAFVRRVLKSMTYFALFPDNADCKGHAGTYCASGTGELNSPDARVVCVYGATHLPGYNGYNTRLLIQETSYKDDFGSDLLNGTNKQVQDNDAYAVWGAGSELDVVVDAYMKLGSITVRVIDKSKISGIKDYSEISETLIKAQATQDEALISKLNGWFNIVIDPAFTPDGWTELSIDDIYIYDKDYPVYEFLGATNEDVAVDANGRFKVAALSVRMLDASAITNALRDNSDDFSLSDGMLVGNTLYITKYDVAVFQGMKEVGDVGSKEYAPLYSYQTTGEQSFHYEFTGDTSPFSEQRIAGYSKLQSVVSRTDGATGKEIEQLILDFSTNSVYRKGALPGASSDFMSLGSDSALSSVVVADTMFKRILGTPYISPSYNTEATQSLSSGASYPTGNFNGIEYTQPLFILADYLELVYSPGIIANEPLVAYGRKIRLDEKLYGNKAVGATENLAYIVDAGASPDLWNSRSYQALTIKDFIDTDGIWRSTDGGVKSSEAYSVNSPPYNDYVAAVHVMDTNEPGSFVSGDPSSERGDMIPQIAAGESIGCVVRFGSALIASADDVRSEYGVNGNPTSTQTPLYGIALYGNLYRFGLFTNWINSSGNVGLDFWAETAKKLGYPNYTINGATLTESMRGNYAFELNQEGLLSLDLDTVVSINEDLVQERRGSGVMVLRTVLMVLGFVLIAYVSVLIAAWALDVNMDLGLNMLEKISFKHFVAVRSIDEMPEPDSGSITTYVDFKGIVARCLAFAVVGVFLITVDPVDLVIKVLNGLNFFLNEISKLIFGTEAF